MAQGVQGNAKRKQKGKGYGVVGDEDFVERVQGRFLKIIRESQEVPGVGRLRVRLPRRRY